MTAPGRKIMIAMDGSKHADYAFDWYMKYFYKEKDDVLIVCCVEHGLLPSTQQTSDTVARLSVTDDSDIAALLTQLQKKLTTAGIKGNIIRLSGSKPGEAIVKASEENKVDMIITGTRGHSTLRRTLMGSVSQYIVHHAHIPVLVVRQ